MMICEYGIRFYDNHGIILGFSVESEIGDVLGLWLAYDTACRIVVWWFLLVSKANPNILDRIVSNYVYNSPKCPMKSH